MVRHLSLDGFTRPKEEDESLNQLALSIFKNPQGEAFLDYLKSITLNAVAGGGVSDGELRHLEGQRYIVALIVKRMAKAEKDLQEQIK